MEETVRVSMLIKTSNAEELRRILDHHIDYLIDMDENSDIISSISEVESYVVNSIKSIKSRFKILKKTIDDIFISRKKLFNEYDYDEDDDDKTIIYSYMGGLDDHLPYFMEHELLDYEEELKRWNEEVESWNEEEETDN